MDKIHKIKNIKIVGNKLIINIDDKEHTYQLKEISERLSKASTIERNKFEISPSGYGIHWPLIDEDISIDGLLDITHSPKKKIKFHNCSLHSNAYDSN
ncbi:MAG: DUF2442 domain-containing protein [bacterium]